MTRTRRVALSKIELTRGNEKVAISQGTLLLNQEYLSDGMGGHIPSMRNWEISVHLAQKQLMTKLGQSQEQ